MASLLQPRSLLLVLAFAGCSYVVVNANEDADNVYLAGVLDTTSSDFGWVEDMFAYTFDQLNQKMVSPQFSYSLHDSNCDEAQATRAYWTARTQNGDVPPHGVVGARCSGASVMVARLAGLEGVPQISSMSLSARLSDKHEFPFFSRVVTPDGVGALVSMLRFFGWDEVVLLATDTRFSIDLVNQFRVVWKGEHDDETGKWVGKIGYADTFPLLPDGDVDRSYVQQSLGQVNDSVSSRIIVLVSHTEHTIDILRTAAEMDFRPDTVWTGPSSWADRVSLNTGEEWVPEFPGYLGVAPFKNRDGIYHEFMKGFQDWQMERHDGSVPWQEMPSRAAETVDAIQALAMALVNTPVSDRRNGTVVTEQLRKSSFYGLTGFVEFTEAGDRKNPKFSIVNMQPLGNALEWIPIGDTGIHPGSATLYDGQVCFASKPCVPVPGFVPPDGRYPEEKQRVLPWWIFLVLAFLALVFALLALKHWRLREKKRAMKAELSAFRNSVVGLVISTKNFLPFVKSDSLGCVEEVKPQAQWCWRETLGHMHKHKPEEVFGDPADCWIKYDDNAAAILESAFQEQGRTGTVRPLPGYTVNFDQMNQTKDATKFQRDVQRAVESDGSSIELIGSDDTVWGEPLPDHLDSEPQMVLAKGDIVQISKRSDRWAFGNKLQYANEEAAQQLFKHVTQGVDDSDLTNVSVDSGWFLLDFTKVPTADDVASLRTISGGGLDSPSHWKPVKDKTIAELHPLLASSDPAEYNAVRNAFTSTLTAPNFTRQVKILEISRVQNLAMWQSFVVKRQTICYRETGITGNESSTDQEKKIQNMALERFEKKWLWHGSNAEVVDKILQQGFNRSFCGKNATAYGKGVYFARDASYSASRTYSVPDKDGVQYMMGCRVVVGEYCRGSMDALTPDVRDAKTHSLYDSTVGLLGADTMSNPSIFVTYHDAQAYPEYLIKFRTH